MRRGRLEAGRLVAVAAVVAATACSGGGPHASPPTSAAAASTSAAPVPSGCGVSLGAGLSAEQFTFDGQARSYELYVPPSYTGTGPVPVVFEFHGYGSNAAAQVVYGDFKPLADRDGFLVVAPNGQGAVRHFNLTGEPGLQDDVAMVGALLDHIEATACVDTRRVYATGMSDGGAMTSALACHDPDRFAAFGAVAVIAYTTGCDPRPVVIESFDGTADPIVPFGGGRVNCCGHPTIGGAPDAIAGWAAHDHCSPTPVVDTLGSQVRRSTYVACAGGTVVFYVIEGGGHTWPGAIAIPSLGLTTRQISATSTIWAFFRAHPMPG